MKAIIDGDLIAYPCAASCGEDDPLEVALFRIDKNLREILEGTDTEDFTLYLSGSNNFRKTINSLYKANRTQQPPKWLQECKEYLISEYGAILENYYEADDLLGINQTDDTILCSFDKDLLMIPGLHFNWKKQQYGDSTSVLAIDGIRHFFKQMLIGDTTDNIIGINRIGKKTADKLLDGINNIEAMFTVVYELYNKHSTLKQFIINANCLWILQQKGETWNQNLNLVLPNQLQQEQDQISEFMKSLLIT